MDSKENSFGRAIYPLGLIVRLNAFEVVSQKVMALLLSTFLSSMFLKMCIFLTFKQKKPSFVVMALHFCAILVFFISLIIMGQFGRFLRGLENVQKPRRRIQNGGCAELITQFRRHMTSLLYCADRKRKQFFRQTMYPLGFIGIAFMLLVINGEIGISN